VITFEMFRIHNRVGNVMLPVDITLPVGDIEWSTCRPSHFDDARIDPFDTGVAMGQSVTAGAFRNVSDRFSILCDARVGLGEFASLG